MGRVDDIARRFSIAGALDEEAATRRKWPIAELDVGAISDHPANAAYSMDEEAIASLAASIEKDGLTDLPLVRRLENGSFQMVSGHRRKAAYALLAEKDPKFSKMPCRIVEGIDDAQSVVLLHAANYFTRALNVVERAQATRALGIEVERMREADPSLSGKRTAELKAAIIETQTGRSVSAATIKRQEHVADLVEGKLIEQWKERALQGTLTDSDVTNLANLDATSQKRVFDKACESALSKRETSALIKAQTKPLPDAAKLARDAVKALKRIHKEQERGLALEASDAAEIERLAREIASASTEKQPT